MAMTFKEVEEVKDEDLFIMTGKDLKDLLLITKNVRSGPTRNDYHMGGTLTEIVCNVSRCPDFIKELHEPEKPPA